jgi:hypothetical protein
MVLPSGAIEVSVSAVLTVFNSAETAVATSVTVPTTKPADVIVVLAVESAVPSGYCGFSFFSFTLCAFTVISCHIMRSSLLGLPMCLQLS